MALRELTPDEIGELGLLEEAEVDTLDEAEDFQELGEEPEISTPTLDQQLESPIESQPDVEGEFTEIAPDEVPADKGFFETIFDEIVGAGENLANLTFGAVLEAAGGVAGLAKTITSGPEAGEKVLRAFQSLNWDLKTPEGQRNMRQFGKFINDAVEFDKQDPVPIVHQMRQIFGQEDNAIGNFMADVAKQTGSPTLEAFAGAFGSTLGPAAMEILGFRGAGKLSRGTGMRAKKKADALADQELVEAMPSPKKYIDTAKSVFKETDKIGATIAPNAMPMLGRRIRQSLADGGYRPDVNPMPQIERMLEIVDSGKTLTTADMRELGKAMAKMGEPGSHQQALGLAVSSELNDFMAIPNALKFPDGTPRNVLKSYQIASKMYGQGKRSQAIANMIEVAKSRGNFMQDMNTQLNALIKKQINGKGEGRFFSKADREVMQKMLADSRGERFLQNMAKLSVFRGNSGGLAAILSSSFGTGVGALTGDIATGAVAAGFPTALGEAARIWGEQLFTKKANLGNKLIQAGNRGRKIARAYVENIPKKQRNPQDLGRLLSDPSIDLSDMPSTKFTLEAMRFADQKRKELLATGVAGSGSAFVGEGDEE